MADHAELPTDRDAELRKLVSDTTALLFDGYLTDVEYQALTRDAEILFRWLFTLRTADSPADDRFDTYAFSWYGYVQVKTLQAAANLLGFYLHGQRKPAKARLLSEWLAPMSLGGGTNYLKVLLDNAESGHFRIDETLIRNTFDVNLAALGGLCFKVLEKLNRKLPVFQTGLAFARWAHSFGAPKYKIMEDLPETLKAYRTYCSAMENLAQAFHDWECELIANQGEENEWEDAKRMMEAMTADVPELHVLRKEEDPEPEPDVPDAGDGDTVTQRKSYHRFTLTKFFSGRLKVEDTQLARTYDIDARAAEAQKAIKILVKTYDAGTGQTLKKNKKWAGAFQNGRGDASRFYADEVFRLPKWNSEKKKYIGYAGVWRLWTDDELKLEPEERVEKFKKDNPKGYGTDR